MNDTYTIQQQDIPKYNVHGLALLEKHADAYLNSNFLVYKQMSSRKKGKYFEMIVAEQLSKQGHNVSRALTSHYDRIIDGKRVEIKGSFLWQGSNNFKWQQIRTNQDYDVVIFVAAYPTHIKMFCATKDVVKFELEKQNEKGEWVFNQHGGKHINSGSFAIQGPPESFEWFKEIGEIF